MTIFDTSHNNRQKWIDEIKKLTGETNDINAIQFALSYTLQSLKHNKKEVYTKFKWKDSSGEYRYERKVIRGDNDDRQTIYKR